MNSHGKAGERMRRVGGAARTVLGRPPEFAVRAPGRVNLLGEHTDYNHLPVLPVAIDRDVVVAGAARHDRTVHLSNADGAFPARRYELGDPVPPFPRGDWGNYSKAAAQGLLRHCGAGLQAGADLYVDGNVPAAAGLSSSAALVVANALALLAANRIDLPYAELAELLAAAEQYVGTLSGGMDQAISLLARPGHALHIDFAPLRVHPVPLPADHSIVVCHSLVHADKSGSAMEAYNRRVIECRLACRLLGHALGIEAARARTLGEITRLLPSRSWRSLVDLLHAQAPGPVPVGDVARLLGVPAQTLRQETGVPAAEDGRYDVCRRARHVLSEAARVREAEAVLRAGDAVAFGRLMDASHASCRDDYEVSCAALDDLVGVAKEAGALGARLTGAGFGGCTVNLVRTAEVDAFLESVDAGFYSKRLTEADTPGNWRFVFTAEGGAEVLRFA